MYDPIVTINLHPDESYEDAPPAFEGRAYEARTKLVPGIYRGTADYTDLADGMDESDAARPGWLIVWDYTPTDARLAAVLSGYQNDTGAVWSDDEYPTIDVKTVRPPVPRPIVDMVYEYECPCDHMPDNPNCNCCDCV